MTADIRGVVRYDTPNDFIKKMALEGGMVTPREAGLRKVAQGVTTLEEVLAIAAE